MKRKGYIYTVSTFFLLSSLLLVALFFSSRSDEMEIAGPKLTYLYDDIRADLYDILETDFYAYNEDNLTFITINDSLQALQVGETLLDYEYFVEKNYTTQVDSDINAREGSLAGADVSMSFANRTFVFVPFNYAYRYENLAKNNLVIFPLPNHKTLRGATINITTERNIFSVSSDIVDGDLPLHLEISDDNNQTFEIMTQVSRNGTSEWIVNMTNHSMRIQIGGGQVLGKQLNSTIKVKPDKAPRTHIVTSLAFNQSHYFEVESGFTITLRDVIGHRLAVREGTEFTKIVDYTKIKDNIWLPVAPLGGDTMFADAPALPNGSYGGGDGEGPPVDLPDPPDFLGYCYCTAPCYYWEELWSDEEPCPSRTCPDWCDNPGQMLTYLL